MTVQIVEVGARDGLQNEKEVLEPRLRAELVNQLAATGLRRIEAGSFVSPTRVPQMADCEAVCAALQPADGETRYGGLVLNEIGYDRLARTPCQEVRVSLCVTDAFNLRNQGRTVAESLEETRAILSRAHAGGRFVSVNLAASFGCPFDGQVSPATVLTLAAEVVAAGADELVFADTIGVGVPRQVEELLRGAQPFGVPLGLHLHNTRNTGYANAYAGLNCGVATLDSSVGGTGGCPFAPRATGNIATEDLLNLLEGEGIDTGIDLDAVVRTTEWLSRTLGRELPGLLSRAGRFTAGVAGA